MPFDEHPRFKPPPNPGAPLFRYMDLAKLLSLLQSGALFFARSDLLGDAFEGSMTKASLEIRADGYHRLPPAYSEELLRKTREEGLEMRFWTFINCWTASPAESVAMWRLYVGDGNGLAIESSYERLVGALGGTWQVFVGMVEYADWETVIIPVYDSLAPYLYKRLGFEYEHELRAIVYYGELLDMNSNPYRPLLPGLSVPVDVQRLVARVRLSPFAEHWYRDVVESVIAKYDYEMEVVQSDLSGEPVF